jgi:hypothetical protein
MSGAGLAMTWRFLLSRKTMRVLQYCKRSEDAADAKALTDKRAKKPHVQR